MYCSGEFLSTLIVWSSAAGVVLSTFDLNNHEIQLVADHLTEEECHKLFTPVGEETDTTFGHPLPTVDDPDKPCLDLLKLWDEETGMQTSFDDLEARLDILGHVDLADKLSTAVYHELSEAVKKSFLDDPFKSLVNRDSPLLDQPVQEDVSGLTGSDTDDPATHRWTWLHTLSLIVVCTSSVIMVWMCCHNNCPTLWAVSPCGHCERICTETFHTKFLGVSAPHDDDDDFMVIMKPPNCETQSADVNNVEEVDSLLADVWNCI